MSGKQRKFVKKLYIETIPNTHQWDTYKTSECSKQQTNWKLMSLISPYLFGTQETLKHPFTSSLNSPR